MDVRQMRSFLAVAETLHFRRAAEILHLSQPSLSHQIHLIEEELGVMLFERTNRRVMLTPAGDTLLLRVRSILQSIDEALQETKRIDKGISGTLTISFVSTALLGKLPHAMKVMGARYPYIDIQLKECAPQEQIAQLLHGESDIGFMHANLHDEHLSSLVAQRDDLIVALPEQMAPTEELVDLRKFGNCTSIMPSPFSTFGFFNHVQRAYQIAGVTPQKIIYTNLIIGGINLVSGGIGIAIVPSSFQSISIKGVVYRKLLNMPPQVELLAFWKSDSKSQILRNFLEILSPKFAKKARPAEQ
jgi:DNA-binding transcriptional LysR family regulator